MTCVILEQIQLKQHGAKVSENQFVVLRNLLFQTHAAESLIPKISCFKFYFDELSIT